MSLTYKDNSQKIKRHLMTSINQERIGLIDNAGGYIQDSSRH